MVPIERGIMTDVEIERVLSGIEEGSGGEEVLGAYGGPP